MRDLHGVIFHLPMENPVMRMDPISEKEMQQTSEIAQRFAVIAVCVLAAGCVICAVISWYIGSVIGRMVVGL